MTVCQHVSGVLYCTVIKQDGSGNHSFIEILFERFQES